MSTKIHQLFSFGAILFILLSSVCGVVAVGPSFSAAKTAALSGIVIPPLGVTVGVDVPGELSSLHTTFNTYIEAFVTLRTSYRTAVCTSTEPGIFSATAALENLLLLVQEEKSRAEADEGRVAAFSVSSPPSTSSSKFGSLALQFAGLERDIQTLLTKDATELCPEKNSYSSSSHFLSGDELRRGRAFAPNHQIKNSVETETIPGISTGGVLLPAGAPSIPSSEPETPGTTPPATPSSTTGADTPPATSSTSSSSPSTSTVSQNDARNAIRRALDSLNEADDKLSEAEDAYRDGTLTGIDKKGIDDAKDDLDRAWDLYREARDRFDDEQYSIALSKADQARRIARETASNLDHDLRKNSKYGTSSSTSSSSKKKGSSSAGTYPYQDSSAASASVSGKGEEPGIVVVTTTPKTMPSQETPFFNKGVFAGLFLVLISVLVVAVLVVALFHLRKREQ